MSKLHLIKRHVVELLFADLKNPVKFEREEGFSDEEFNLWKAVVNEINFTIDNDFNPRKNLEDAIRKLKAFYGFAFDEIWKRFLDKYSTRED